MNGYRRYFMPSFWSFTAYTPTIPKLYWDVRSQEQRILNIFQLIDKVIAYADEIGNLINQMNQDLASKEDLENAVQAIYAKIDEIENRISQISEGVLTWDVQHGYYTNSVDAQRDMFNDVTVHAISIEELNAIDVTVETLANSGLNVKGFALYNDYLLDNEIEVPNDCKYHVGG